MRRGRKRIAGPVLAAAGADSAAAASATAKVAAPVAVAGTPDNAASLAGKGSGLNRPESECRPENNRGRILWLVDQAQHSRSDRKNWLARTSSAKKRPR